MKNQDTPKSPFKTPPGYWEARKPALKALARREESSPPVRRLRPKPLFWTGLAAAALTALAWFVWPDTQQKAPPALPPEAIAQYLQGEALPPAAISAGEPAEIRALFDRTETTTTDSLSQKAILQYLKSQNPENLFL